MDRYNGVARALHWAMALLIILALVLGIGHDALPKDWAVIPIHKSIGLTVLALTLVRIVWRLANPAPRLTVAMPSWEKGAAHATHALFYIFMIVLPLSGWIMTSAGTRPLNWFFLFDVPKFAVGKEDAIVGLSRGAHELLPWLWVALIILSVDSVLFSRRGRGVSDVASLT